MILRQSGVWQVDMSGTLLTTEDRGWDEYDAIKTAGLNYKCIDWCNIKMLNELKYENDKKSDNDLYLIWQTSRITWTVITMDAIQEEKYVVDEDAALSKLQTIG